MHAPDRISRLDTTTQLCSPQSVVQTRKRAEPHQALCGSYTAHSCCASAAAGVYCQAQSKDCGPAASTSSSIGRSAAGNNGSG
jgi:hypothetical protein